LPLYSTIIKNKIYLRFENKQFTHKNKHDPKQRLYSSNDRSSGKAIAKAVGFKEQGSHSQALETLNDFYSEHFDLMYIENETNSIKLDLYGNLLKLKADIYQKKGNKDKSRLLFVKALQILSRAELESKSFDLKRNRLIEEIQLSLK
tara:strand:+ start:47214 stop:47654 length:441 start_codon:yes stop_codon:yes gene_type:complete